MVLDLDLDEAQQRAVNKGDIASLAREISDLNKALDRWCRWQDEMIGALKAAGLYDRIIPLLDERYRSPQDVCRHFAELYAAREVIASILADTELNVSMRTDIALAVWDKAAGKAPS